MHWKYYKAKIREDMRRYSHVDGNGIENNARLLKNGGVECAYVVGARSSYYCRAAAFGPKGRMYLRTINRML